MGQTSETKEEVYDTQISPLIVEIIAICHKYKIAHVCAFTLDEEVGLCCITANTEEDREPEDRLSAARLALYFTPPALMITTRGSDGNIKESTVMSGRGRELDT